ncbi:hypothetical protein B0H34DRAFT_249108 [Crassisporium funariophilum]|nr:hypothetical protein B0H34DRAFT_249108 [Crassisporium funariophilum]
MRCALVAAHSLLPLLVPLPLRMILPLNHPYPATRTRFFWFFSPECTQWTSVISAQLSVNRTTVDVRFLSFPSHCFPLEAPEAIQGWPLSFLLLILSLPSREHKNKRMVWGHCCDLLLADESGISNTYSST